MPPTPQIEIRVNRKDLDRYDKALAKLQGRPLYERVDKSLLAIGNKIVVPEARRQFASSRRAPHMKHAGKRFGTSITARKTRQRRFGELAAVTVKPRTPLAHLVIQGTKQHSLATKREGKGSYAAFGPDQVRATAGLQHPGSQGNPFMDRTRAATDDAVAAAIGRDVMSLVR